MARSRSLKPSFFTNEQLAECTHFARLLFAGLWCLADRAGKLRDRPRKIKAELFPYEAGTDVEPQLAELAREGLILRYEVAGERFIKIPGFEKHQHPHPKEPPTEIPEPCNAAAGNGETTASRGEILSSPAGSSCNPLPVTLAVPAAAADASTAPEQAPWEVFRDQLSDRMAVPRDWLRVANAERAFQVREQLDAEIARLGMARAVEVAADSAAKAKGKPRWLAYFVGPLQDARRSDTHREAWEGESPKGPEAWPEPTPEQIAEWEAQAKAEMAAGRA